MSLNTSQAEELAALSSENASLKTTLERVRELATHAGNAMERGMRRSILALLGEPQAEGGCQDCAAVESGTCVNYKLGFCKNAKRDGIEPDDLRKRVAGRFNELGSERTSDRVREAVVSVIRLELMALLQDRPELAAIAKGSETT